MPAFVRNWWPVMVVAATVVFGGGAVSSDVSAMKEEIREVKAVDTQAATERGLLKDSLVRVETRQTNIAEDVNEIQKDVKEVLKAVKSQ